MFSFFDKNHQNNSKNFFVLFLSESNVNSLVEGSKKKPFQWNDLNIYINLFAVKAMSFENSSWIKHFP